MAASAAMSPAAAAAPYRPTTSMADMRLLRFCSMDLDRLRAQCVDEVPGYLNVTTEEGGA
ncbi:hypothetical protein SCMC78_51560 [Streptomyces sp. CMC78]|uniref:Uncharacterized protein n=1 Tax=Streptomyces sp. CMC78 TaxID=3231512 RepID=A0AB33KNH4_9ACTN